MSFDIPIEIKPGSSKQVIAAIGSELDKVESKGKKAGESISNSLNAIQKQLESIRAAANRSAGALSSSFGSMADAIRRTENVLERIRGPMREHERDMQALALLYRQGRINAAEFTAEVQRMNTALRGAPKQGFAGGVLSGIGGSLVGGGAAGVGMAAAQMAMSGIGEIAGLADAYTNLGNRINQVAKGTDDHARLMERTKQIANATRSDWASTGETFVRLTNATKDMGLSQGRVLQLTETIGKAFSMSGASATEASAGMLQLSQAFASGKLQGDEFRSLAEAVPSILDLVAKQMGVSRGALKQLGSEGKITSDVLVAAFTNAQQSIDNGFAKTAPTISQQWAGIKNQLTETFGKFAQDSHVFETMGRALKTMADTLSPVVNTVGKLFGKVDQLLNRLEKTTGIDFKMGSGEAFGAINDKIGVGLLDLDDEVMGANNVMPQWITNMQTATAMVEKFAEARSRASVDQDNTPWGKTSQADLRTFQDKLDDVGNSVRIASAGYGVQFEMLKTYLGDLATSGISHLQAFGADAENWFSSLVPKYLDQTIAKLGVLRDSLASFNKSTMNGPRNPILDMGNGAGDDITADFGSAASAGSSAVGWAAGMIVDYVADKMGSTIKQGKIWGDDTRFKGTGAGRRSAYQAPIRDNIWSYSLSERVQQGIDFFKNQPGALGGIGDQSKGVLGIDIQKATDDAVDTVERAHKRMTDSWTNNLRLQREAMDPWKRGLSDGWDAVRKQATDVSGAITQTMTNAYKGMEDALVSLVTTGKASFSDLVNSIMADLTRLATRQLLMSLIGLASSGGGAKSVFGTGATQAWGPGLYGGGHATGGSWKAPSTGGGPDSIPVMFRMSPGETAHFTPQGAAAQGGGAQIVNQIHLDDRQLTAMIDTPAGRKAIANVIRLNPGMFPFGRR